MRPTSIDAAHSGESNEVKFVENGPIYVNLENTLFLTVKIYVNQVIAISRTYVLFLTVENSNLFYTNVEFYKIIILFL